MIKSIGLVLGYINFTLFLLKCHIAHDSIAVDLTFNWPQKVEIQKYGNILNKTMMYCNKSTAITDLWKYMEFLREQAYLLNVKLDPTEVDLFSYSKLQ